LKKGNMMQKSTRIRGYFIFRPDFFGDTLFSGKPSCGIMWDYDHAFLESLTSRKNWNEGLEHCSGSAFFHRGDISPISFIFCGILRDMGDPNGRIHIEYLSRETSHVWSSNT